MLHEKRHMTLTLCRTYEYSQFRISWWPLVMHSTLQGARSGMTSVQHCYCQENCRSWENYWKILAPLMITGILLSSSNDYWHFTWLLQSRLVIFSCDCTMTCNQQGWDDDDDDDDDGEMMRWWDDDDDDDNKMTRWQWWGRGRRTKWG